VLAASVPHVPVCAIAPRLESLDDAAFTLPQRDRELACQELLKIKIEFADEELSDQCGVFLALELRKELQILRGYVGREQA
jgi:hypothetical protein